MTEEGEHARFDYDHREHERAIGYSRNVKLRDLLPLTNDEILRRHDDLLHESYGNSAMWSGEYREWVSPRHAEIGTGV